MDKPLNKTTVISEQDSFKLANLVEVWEYRYLVKMLVNRDFISQFKQTILGALWFFINPLLTAVVYVFIFGNVIKLSTDGVPHILFYLSGIILWEYFSSTMLNVSEVYRNNIHILGKVYIPKLVFPISLATSNLLKLGVQLLPFSILLFYNLHKNLINPNIWILATPFLILLLLVLAVGLGMLFSAYTTKYRDIALLLGFGTNLLMFATPVIYPISLVPNAFKNFAYYNPLTGIITCFRYAWFGSGDFKPIMLLYSFFISVFILIVGIRAFYKTGRTFLDTV